jgi:hypothetical protein
LRVDAAAVDKLVDAYQGTLAQARDSFGEGWEARVVVATVAENARAARQRLVTSVPGGEALTSRLDTFLEEAQKMDVVGRWLRAVQNYAAGAAKKLAGEVMRAALGVSALPTISAIGGLILAVGGILQGIGRAIGGAVALLILGAIAFASRYPHTLVHVGRLVPRAAAGLQAQTQWVANRFTAAVQTADTLGRGAEALVEQTLGQPARSFFGGGRPPGWEVSSRVRGIAKGVLYCAVVVIVVCLVVIGVSIVSSVSEGLAEARCPRYPGEVCL